MSEAKTIEYFSLTYMPNAASKTGVPIAAIFFDASDLETGFCGVRLASNWERKVRGIDLHVDIRMLRASLIEIRDRLLSGEQRQQMIGELENAFSNAIQVSPRAALPASFPRENIDRFAGQILNDTSQSVCRTPRRSHALRDNSVAKRSPTNLAVGEHA
jgi:hypothetical protein